MDGRRAVAKRSYVEGRRVIAKWPYMEGRRVEAKRPHMEGRHVIRAGAALQTEMVTGQR